MQKQNAILGTIVRVTPPRGEEAGSVELEGGRSARLDAGDRRSAGFAEVLSDLQQRGRPAYLEVDPASGAVAVLRVPLVVQVEALRTTDAGDVQVELRISHARHLVRRSDPEFDALVQALRDAQRSEAWVAVAETDAHEIVAVAPFRPPGELPRLEPVREPSPLLRLIRWILRCLAWRRCVSARRAKELFDMVASTTCAPLTVPPPCIPFLYPDDGCWGRAHEMCRLMIQAGASPRKVWIYGWLQTPTRNHPNCMVYWGWHVAPTLCVRRRLFWFFWWRQEQVIDPSLFNAPVSKATWKGVQGDPSATLAGSAASAFYRTSGGSITTDPTYAGTNAVLADYRAALKARALSIGAPPYANCP